MGVTWGLERRAEREHAAGARATAGAGETLQQPLADVVREHREGAGRSEDGRRTVHREGGATGTRGGSHEPDSGGVRGDAHRVHRRGGRVGEHAQESPDVEEERPVRAGQLQSDYGVCVFDGTKRIMVVGNLNQTHQIQTAGTGKLEVNMATRRYATQQLSLLVEDKGRNHLRVTRSHSRYIHLLHLGKSLVLRQFHLQERDVGSHRAVR